MLRFLQKRLFILWLLLPAGTLSGQPGGAGNQQAAARYREARQAFEAYEKAHGHFVQTGNGKMHYLAWGNPGGIPFV